MEVVVKDSIEVRGQVAEEYGATGVVVVFELPMLGAEPQAGMSVVIVRPDGWLRAARVGEVQEHGGSGRSFFLSGMTREDVPIGTRLRWGGRVRPEDLVIATQQTA